MNVDLNPETGDYRERLKLEFNRRLQARPSYSLRGFARDLRISPSRLSEVLNGKKGLSREAAYEIGSRLGLSASQLEWFCDSVDSKHARSPLRKKQASQRVLKTESRAVTSQKANRLSQDTFRAMADWYYLALIELLRTGRVKHEAKALASELSISPFQATEALARLERLKLIKKIDTTRKSQHRVYMIVDDTVLSPDGFANDAVKAFQGQILDRCKEALHLQPVNERDFFTYIMAMRTEDLPEIRLRARKFLESINEEFSVRYQGSGQLDRVMSLSYQLINLAKSGEIAKSSEESL